MNLMKPIDNPIHGMGSKSPGRNASEPTGGLVKKKKAGAEPSGVGRRQHERSHSDRSDQTLRRGGRAHPYPHLARWTPSRRIDPGFPPRSEDFDRHRDVVETLESLPQRLRPWITI